MSILMGHRGTGVYVEKYYKEGMYKHDPSRLYFSQPIVSRISTCTGITWRILLSTDPDPTLDSPSDLRFCTSPKFTGDADAAGQRMIL